MTAAASTAVRSSDPDGPYRVLIVDDSAVIRGMIGRALRQDPEIEVVGSVPNGKLAVDHVTRHPVEVVVLDIEMPVMDGLEALPKMIVARPNIKVIMASTLTLRGASVSIKALSLGASDFIPKPTATREMGAADNFAKELVERIKVLGASARGDGGASARRSASARPSAGKGDAATSLKAGAKVRPPIVLHKPGIAVPRVIAIGSSTGGPKALLTVLAALDKKITLPILITQHMPATFTTILAEHLTTATGRPCSEGKDGDVVEEGHMYLAPGDYHMTVEKVGVQAVLRLDQGPQVNFCRPSVDPMFRSISAFYGSSVLGLILTGMGSDGLAGGKILVDKGGTLIAQDEASSVVWGMPGAVATEGLCSAVVPLDRIAAQLATTVKGGGR